MNQWNPKYHTLTNHVIVAKRLAPITMDATMAGYSGYQYETPPPPPEYNWLGHLVMWYDHPLLNRQLLPMLAVE